MEDRNVQNTAARIIALFSSRDERALTEVQRAYGHFCMGIAMNILHNRQDAEECVNDTWLRAWNHIPPDRPLSLAAYLARIVRNLAFDRRDYNGRRQTPLALDELVNDIPMADEAANELPALLNAFLGTVDALDRRLFVGRYFYNRRVEAMAKAYSLSANTAAKRLSRMRQALRVYLEERGYHI